ncbi:MAG: sporulation integral membrane protein YlbJ [Sarcina sp.]
MYSIFFLIFLSIILLILLTKILKLKINTILSILLSILILYFIIKPELVINSSINGGKIFLTSIFPVMFPFMVICNFLLNVGGIAVYSKLLGSVICKPLALNKSCSFPIITSWLCGYPLGAKYSANLYEQKAINFNEFSRLINIATNIGPLFLIASVGTTMLSNTELGYLLLIPNYFSPIILGLFLRKNNKNNNNNNNLNSNFTNSSFNLGEAIKKSIEDASLTILTLGGYIVIFSVLINILKESIIMTLLITIISSLLGISKVFLESIFLGSIELTNGCKIITSSPLSLEIKLCVISFLSSFGGLSIIAQTYAFFSKYNISFKKYFFFKFLQGIISASITAIICLFMKNSISSFAPTILSSANSLMLLSIILFIICLLLTLKKLLRKIN